MYQSKTLYLYDPDPDWIPLYALAEDSDEGSSEYELPWDEYVKYMNVVSYVENLHKKMKLWRVSNES